jgi:hypothetical protein
MSPDNRQNDDQRQARTNPPPLPGGLVHVIQEVGDQALDRRTTRGKAFVQWRQALVEDLGGMAVVTATELALVDLTARDKLALDIVDSYLFKLPSLVNGRKRTLSPIVQQRQQLADSLARRLSLLLRLREARPRSPASVPVSRDGHAAKAVDPNALAIRYPELMADTPEARAKRERLRELFDRILAVRAMPEDPTP